MFVSDKLIILSKDYNHISIDRSMYSGSSGNSSSGGYNRISMDSSELCTVPPVVATAQSDYIQLPTFGKLIKVVATAAVVAITVFQWTALSVVQYQQWWQQHNQTAFNFQHLEKGNI